MKELSTEEKLRAYNEAIRRAKIALGCCNSASTETKNTIYNIFPELEDERIREDIIDYLKQKYSDPNAIKYDYDKWIAWLEKEGETKTNSIDIDAMVLRYSLTREEATNSLPINCQLRSYRQGIKDTLEKI